jgi:hypothetical protein
MVSRSARAGALALAAVVLVTTVMIEIAVAGTFNSQISINFQGGTFSGRVNSSRAFCEVGRTVKLFKVRRARRDKLIGTATTNDSGRWSIQKRGADGRFYARVLQEDARDYPGVHRCRGDVSRVIRV